MLRINDSLCTGCGLCARACPAKALHIRERKAAANADACTLCGACVDACRLGALSLPAADPAARQEASGVWVFAEQAEGRVLPVAFELLGKGRALADTQGCRLTAILAGAGAAEARRLVAGGTDEVLLCEEPALGHKLELPYAELVAGLAAAHRPAILLFGATAFGRSLAPRVAARVGAGLTADCTALEIDSKTGLLRQTRPAFGGNLMATIVTERHRPQMATVRPGVMQAPPPNPARQGRITRVPAPAPDPRVALLETAAAVRTKSIADAPVIVSAGRGIGSQKNLALVRELAGLLGGAMGASRPLVDMGWCEYRHQIGQTGLAVAPRLLICCGISGAIQHLAGIGGAQTVVAINTDPAAPIFSAAHYRVVGECVPVLRAMIAQARG